MGPDPYLPARLPVLDVVIATIVAGGKSSVFVEQISFSIVNMIFERSLLTSHVPHAHALRHISI